MPWNSDWSGLPDRAEGREAAARHPGRALSLLVLDDHRIFAEVLASSLLARPEIAKVDVSFTLASARALTRRTSYDVVLVDYDLDRERGLDLLPDLAVLHPPPPMLMLSAVTDAEVIVGAMRSGVAGWVSKDESIDTVLVAADQAAKGRLYLSPPVVRSVLPLLLRDAGHAPAPSFVDHLSARELEVLRCLVAGLSRAEVAERLFISSNTVRTHVQHLLERAGVHSTLALVTAARNAGVRGIDEEQA